jgi:flagellar hook-associated protein 2
MSDLIIPGISTNTNTQKIIDALMNAERVPLERMQKEQALDQQKKTAWQDVTRRLSGLRDSARALFSFQNPFTEKVAQSSDANILTATAKRDAVEESKRITVKQVATADRFLSQSLPKDFTVPAGEYVFTIGGKEVRFTFKGGSLKEFADALIRRGGDLLTASVVSDTKSTQVLLVEAKKTGANNRLVFNGKSADLALKAGIIERSANAVRQLALTQKGITAWAKALTPDMYALQNGTLTLNPGSEMRIAVDPSVQLNANMVLELSVKTEALKEPAPEQQAQYPGPAIPETGSVEFEGITVQSSKMRAPTPEIAPAKPPEKVSDMQVLFMEGGGKLIPLPQITDSADFQKIQIPVGELSSALDWIDLRNRNTYRKVSIKDISLYDKTQRGEYTPKNPLSQAADAVISMDGIEVKRDSNQIDDLVPGVTLNLHASGASPVEMKVGRDVEGIKNVIVGFIGSYDRVITDMDVLTRRDESVITDAAFLSDDEKKKAADNLGLLFGDLSLQQLKDAMQRVMMNAYPTSRGRDLAMLAQIGIATDVRKPGTSTGVDLSKLRGYLELDEPKFDDAIRQNAEAVKELFGNDTNGDLVVNAGVAYSLDALLRPYVQTAGIFPAKVANLDSEIARTKRKITDYQQHLNQYQAQLKQKYAAMEGAVQQLEKNSQQIDNFNKRSQ